jgi:hypothetical protein
LGAYTSILVYLMLPKRAWSTVANVKPMCFCASCYTYKLGVGSSHSSGTSHNSGIGKVDTGIAIFVPELKVRVLGHCSSNRSSNYSSTAVEP